MVRAQCGESAARRAKEKARAAGRPPRAGGADFRSGDGGPIHAPFTLAALRPRAAGARLPPSANIIIIPQIVRVLLP